MKTSCDVLIVGAGPAGSTCAETLAKRGVSVVVLDKKNPGWHKPCGGGIPEVVFGRYNLPSSLGFSTPVVRVVDGTGREERSSYPYRDVFRNVFDEHLADRARKAGADIAFGSLVQDIVRTDTGFRARTAAGEIEAKYLVAADGAMSMVRRKLFPEQLTDDMCAMALEYWYRVDHSVRSLDFFLEPDLLDSGYSYVFPKDPTTLVVGIAAVGIEKPRVLLDEMLKRPRYASQIAGEPIAVHGARIPYRHLSRLRDGRLLLVGDAGGLNTPIIFAGIPVALASGKLAGTLLADSLSSGSDAPLAKYTAEGIGELSFGFKACHAYYDYLCEHRRAPSFGWLAAKFVSRPHKIPAAFLLWKSLNRLIAGLNLERLAVARHPAPVAEAA